MSHTIILIRHAQALHNLSRDSSIPDPPLTPLGEQQCTRLADSLAARFPHLSTDDIATSVRIIASPMRRTLQTALLALGWLVERGVRIEADADWQENSDNPCDTGSPLEKLSSHFPLKLIDFSSLDPIYPSKSLQDPSAQAYHYTRDSISARGQRCLSSLRRQVAAPFSSSSSSSSSSDNDINNNINHSSNSNHHQDEQKEKKKIIFVVSHAGFLRLGVTGKWFDNADYRVGQFDLITGSLVWDEETKRTGGMGTSLEGDVELGRGLPGDKDKDANSNVDDNKIDGVHNTKR